MDATTAGAAAAAAVWAVLVARAPPWFFTAAAPFCAAWIALSLRAAPAAAAPRRRPGAADVALALALALALYAGTRAVLWAGCGGWSSALCTPLGGLYARFATRTPFAALVLAVLVAPAEELFWRGVVQGRLVRRLGALRGVATAASLSALVPLATGEVLLALAALPTSLAWGALAAWRGVGAAVVSHAAWTVLVASIAPPI
jgi:membrane protease YdiL (CAAX protease family)